MKMCSKCKENKSLDEFHNSKRATDGKKSSCKSCISLSSKKYLEANKDNLEFQNQRKKLREKWLKNSLSKNPNYYKDEYLKHQKNNLIKSRKFYAINKEEINRKSRERWKNDSSYVEYKKTYTGNWRLKNIGRVSESHSKWTKDNADKVKAYNQMRRAKKKDATICKFSYKDVLDRMSVFGFRCSYCKGDFEHIDHVKPLSKGGPHCLANLRPACKKCNLSKYNKSLKDFIASRENK